MDSRFDWLSKISAIVYCFAATGIAGKCQVDKRYIPRT